VQETGLIGARRISAPLASLRRLARNARRFAYLSLLFSRWTPGNVRANSSARAFWCRHRSYPSLSPWPSVPQDVTGIHQTAGLEREAAAPDALRQAIGHSKTGTVTNLHLNEIRKIRVPCPPIEMQDAFVAQVVKIRALENDQATSRHRTDDLFQSLLHRAFQGEL
jgi:hypothetical protein